MRTLSRRAFVKSLAAASLAGLAPLSLPGGCRAASGRKLNILFIMSDQHSARALGCCGNREVRTPNLDRLAAGGVLCQQAFCQTAQCVPSRYSIFTGRYARSHGTYSNGQGQNPQEQTVAELFKKAGYATATIGKHHMVMDQTTQDHGFDVVFAGADGRFAQRGEFLPFEEVHPGRSNVGKSAVGNDEHPAGIITTKALEFLRGHRDQPFVLWYSFSGPHTPICPSSPWADMYQPEELTLPPNLDVIDKEIPQIDGLLTKSGQFSEKQWWHRRTLAYYYGLVSQIDHNIGRVLTELDNLGLSDHTLVVYTADHGEMMAEHGAWTKGRSCYEGTIRVPMILRWPGALSAGKRIDELVCLIDLLPTLLEAAGQPIPANVQGASLLPLIRGQNKQWRDTVFSEIGNSTRDTCIAVRRRRHKYVLFRDQGQT
ncbi:MAG: sulfatase-like hydrolase/transferase, partial [Planctomycetes bacterium]|nr:sulfatase-like hydrolase/transferase [Planctomycetota bacterium]